ncbi:MAG: hypothetical protein OHK0046_26640 [Anaerolineae bacterium]
MEQWEYMPTYLQAEAKGKDIKEFLRQKFDLKRPPRYMVEALMPELNRLGAEGWELVHMEPVAKLNRKGTVLFGVGYRWSNVYFCVFKRRRSIPQVMPMNAEGQPAFQPPQSEPDPLPIVPRVVPVQEAQPSQPAAQPQPVSRES